MAVTEDTTIDVARLTQERDEARRELAGLRAWRTRAVNIANRAARVYGWCTTFEGFMMQAGLPGRPEFASGGNCDCSQCRESRARGFEEGWSYNSTTRRWSFDGGPLGNPPDGDEVAVLTWERDQLRRKITELRAWRTTLPEIMHRYGGGGYARSMSQVFRAIGIPPHEAWGAYNHEPVDPNLKRDDDR